MTYDYPDDGKFHTRYSELARATDGQIDRIVAERLGLQNTFRSTITDFGSIRHEMLHEYIKEHKKLPRKFGLDLPCDPKHSECHLAIEMWPGIVLHGTPDAFGDTWIADFKTTTRGKQAYKTSKQTVFYAWMLSYYGKQIETVYYLCELWNPERTRILGYEHHKQTITPSSLREVASWSKVRATRLKKALEQRQTIGAIHV